jgi:hypothetical protein
MTSRNRGKHKIPVTLTESQFNEFILPYIPGHRFGPHFKISRYKMFYYIMIVLYTGCQWKMIPIEKDENGDPEIHYTQVFKVYQQWTQDESIVDIFVNSVAMCHRHGFLETSTLHGDGSTTMAKKGGDCLGYSGHKHMRGEKVIAFCDRKCNVISPMTIAPGNRHESPLFCGAFDWLKNICKRVGIVLQKSIASLDSAYDSQANRKQIFNAGMVPNIKENPRNRRYTKRGRKRIYNPAIFKERFRTIERVFAWEDKFKRLLLRFEHISLHHFGF